MAQPAHVEACAHTQPRSACHASRLVLTLKLRFPHSRQSAGRGAIGRLSPGLVHREHACGQNHRDGCAYFTSLLFYCAEGLCIITAIPAGFDRGASEYFNALSTAIQGTIVLTAAVLAAKYNLPSGLPLIMHLGLLTTTGVAAYVTFILVFHKDRVRAFKQTINLLRTRGVSQ